MEKTKERELNQKIKQIGVGKRHILTVKN